MWSIFTAGVSPQTDAGWADTHVDFSYARGLLADHACSRAPGACTVNSSDTNTLSGALGYPSAADASRPTVCSTCSHGSHMVPYLVRRYDARSVIEVGVCTGATVVSTLRQHGDSIDSYTAIDAWGERRCNPGCGCYGRLRPIAERFPALHLIQAYSVPASASIADASSDLVFVDAAHDYENVHADVLAYWPKVKPGGVLAGHDFAHHRNWAEILERRQAHARTAEGRRGKRIPPSYGVGQALAELFVHCELHVRFGVWWVERRLCRSGPIATNRSEALWQRPRRRKGKGRGLA